IATGAALPVVTEHPAIEDDYSTPNFLSTVVFADYFGPTLPTTTKEDLNFPAETPFPSKANGETTEAVGEEKTSSPGELPHSELASSKDDSASLATTPKTFKIPEDLKEISEVPSVDKNVLHQVNSSQPTLGKESLQGDSLAESQEVSKETPPPDLEAGHKATELITERYSGVIDAPVTVFATSEEVLLASPSREEAQSEIPSTSPPEGEKPLENIPGEPNLDEEGKPTSTSWEETEVSPLEAEKDTPEPSTDESGGTLEDPSSNPTVFPSTPEDLSDQKTGENVDAGDVPSLSSVGSPETSTGFPPIWPTHENVGSPGTSDLDVGSLQPSPAGVDSGSPAGRGDADPIPSSSSEPNHESPVNLPREEPEDILDAEASNSSPSDDAPSDSGPPGDTLVRTSQLDASDIPLVGLSITPEIPSQLPEDGEIGAASTVKEEGEDDSGNPKSDEGTSLVSPLPGQESAQGTEIPDEERSEDLLSGTASSLNPGVETANSELEGNEMTTTSNSLPGDEINPITSDLATGNESGALFDTMVSSPPPVDNEGADQAQEPPAETQGSPAEASVPASIDGPSSETEGNEVSPNESPGNIGSSLDEVNTEANSEDLSPLDTELSSSSGTPLPMGRSGTLDDQLSPSQSLVDSAPTSGSSSSSEGEPTFPSTSPDEALSGPLISEPDTTELLSNSLPGSQPSSQLPKENDMETDTGDVEDSPPVDNEGAAKAQGPPAETSAPASTSEPSSEREGTEDLPSGSPGNMGSSSENSGTIPSVSSDEVDTQANDEDHSVSDLPPSDTEISSISGIPLATSSQPPKADDVETHSEDPEDSVSINGEETSSAPSIINPQLALAEATEEPSISGDLSDGPILSSKEEKNGSTSEPGVNEEPLLDGDNTQDKINIPPSEQQLGSEDALDTSIPSSGNEPAVKSGTISPFVDTETSTKTQEPSGEKSSASIEDRLSNSENEHGEPSPGLSSKTLDSSPGGDVIDESRDEEDDARSASSAQTAVATSNNGQPGSDFPVRQLVTSPVGGILALAPIEDGETSVPRDDDQLSTGAVSSEDVTPQSASSAEGAETSASEPSAVGSWPSPDGDAAPETSKDKEQLQTSAASEKVSPLASSTTESQEPTASESGEFSGALNQGSPAFPVEVAGTANSPPATDKGSQALPEGVASADGVKDHSEEITNMISEKSSQDPLDRGSESKTSTSEEDAEGRIDGELSLNNNGTETATLESANNGGSQLPPDGAQLSATTGSSEISEGASGVNGKEGSLIPSAAESHSTFTSEEVENANSEPGTHPESKPSLDGLPTTEVQDSKSSEAVEDTSNNGEKLSLTLSSSASQSPGISDGEDVSGGTGNEESSLPGEELETAGSGSTNNAEAQPSVAGGAAETSDVSNRVEQLENSSSAYEGETSLASSAAESSTAPKDLEVSGKPSGGDGMEAVNSEPATNPESPSSPNGPGGVTVSEEAGIPEVSGTSDGSSAASAPEPQAISSSNEEETSNTATNAGPQLPLDGESAAGTPPPDGAEISEVSSSVPGEKGPLSPSTQESLEDSSSTKEVGTASRKSTTDEGSQLSADGTSPEDSLASEGAEPVESHTIVSGDQTSLVPPATELQFPETSANENVLGGLENEQSSLSPGEEIANAGSSNNVGFQTSPDSVATEGEGAETSEDNSIVSEKQLSVAPSSTEPQSPGTSVSKVVSQNLVNGEPSLSTDGGKEATNIGTAGAQGSTSSSTGTGPDQKNIAEQFGDNSDSMSGQSSVDGTMISKSSEETSISSSVSSDGNLAAQGTSQDVGAPDSSQPSSDNQANLANSVNAGSAEASVLGDHISTGDTLGVSDGPILDADGEVLQGFSEALDSVGNLVHPSSAKGNKPAAGQLLGVVSPQQDVGAPDSSQPSSDNQANLANSVNAGSAEDSVLGDHISTGDTLGVSDGPILDAGGEVLQGFSEALDSVGQFGKFHNAGSAEDSVLGDHISTGDTLGVSDGPILDAGGEVLQGFSEALDSVGNLVHPSSAKENKPAAGQLLGVVSPLASLPPQNGLLSAPSNLGGPKLGNVVGKGSSPLTLEDRGEVLNSILAVHKEISTASSADALPLSSKPEVPAKASKLASGKPGLQLKAGSPLLSLKTEVPQETPQLPSGKPGLQLKAGSPLLSSKPEVPAKASKLASGKPGLQLKAGSPLLSCKTEVPEETPQLPSGKPGLQLKAGSPLLSLKTEVPQETPQLPSGKPGLQLKAGSPLLSLKTEVPQETPQLPSGKPGLQLKAGSPLLSLKTEVPQEMPQLPSERSGIQLKSDYPLLSFNSDILANSERILPGKPGPASPDSSSASDENDGDSSSGPNLSKEHQTLMKGKVALDLSKAKTDGSEPGVHLALSGVGLLVTKSSKPTGKLAKKKSDLKKSKDKKTKPFTDNGQIVFPASDQDIASYPNPPSGGFNGREKVPMVAVFWDNADFSKGSGTIFYQEYPCGNSAKDPLVQDVEAKIRQYVKSSYRARWLLKVTWDKVQPYPAQRQKSKVSGIPGSIR
ncbi:hypothetical protein E2320_009312, partial [Naja naja]